MLEKAQEAIKLSHPMSPVDHSNLFFPCAKTAGDFALQQMERSIGRVEDVFSLSLARSFLHRGDR